MLNPEKAEQSDKDENIYNGMKSTGDSNVGKYKIFSHYFLQCLSKITGCLKHK